MLIKFFSTTQQKKSEIVNKSLKIILKLWFYGKWFLNQVVFDN